MGCLKLNILEKCDYLRITFRAINNAFSKILNYYPFGMEMPGRTDFTVSGANWRYGYQGLFAERDGLTGKNDFMLRQYESRLGRWLTKDPMGQYSSPYMAMGNNPVSFIDPSGGEDIYYETLAERSNAFIQMYSNRHRYSWLQGFGDPKEEWRMSNGGDLSGFNMLLAENGISRKGWDNAKYYKRKNATGYFVTVRDSWTSYGERYSHKEFVNTGDLQGLYNAFQGILQNFAYDKAEQDFGDDIYSKKGGNNPYKYDNAGMPGKRKFKHLYDSKYSTNLSDYFDTKNTVTGMVTIPNTKIEVYLGYVPTSNNNVDNIYTSDHLQSLGTNHIIISGPAIILQNGSKEKAYMIFKSLADQKTVFRMLYSNVKDKRYNYLMKQHGF